MSSSESWGLTVVILVVSLIAAGLGAYGTRVDYQAAAIEHNCAAYDPITGDWGWITQETPTDD